MTNISSLLLVLYIAEVTSINSSAKIHNLGHIILSVFFHVRHFKMYVCDVYSFH